MPRLGELRPRPCRCGGRLVHATRYGPRSGQATPTLCCFDCAYEEPTLYGRETRERNGQRVYASRPTGPMPGAWMTGRLTFGRRR